MFPKACLFNISADPCEYNDIAADHPEIVAALKSRLATFNAVPPENGQGCMPNIVQVPCSDGSGTCPVYQPCDAPPLMPRAHRALHVRICYGRRHIRPNRPTLGTFGEVSLKGCARGLVPSARLQRQPDRVIRVAV
jgi:hypothetical protein